MRAQKIYDITMALMDEMLNDGNVDRNSTKDYTARTPGILTILQNEIQAKLGLEALDPIKNMQGDVDLDDLICYAVLPYALASRLLGQEDSSLSNYFNQMYGEKLAQVTSQFEAKAEIVDRPDLYGSSLRVGD